MPQFDNLDMRLSVKDDATAALKRAADAQRELTGAMTQARDEAKRAGESQRSVAGDVFKGVAAWDILKKAVSGAMAFFGSSIQESMQASTEMALMRQNVENAGLSYDRLASRMASASDAAARVGFAGGQAGLELSKLMLITKDYDQALKLQNLSMDLARSKNIGLAEATTIVTQVTQGNNKVLKQYGIELDDTADAADNLAKLQDKVRGSAEAYAETTAGKLAIVTEQWNEVKEAVGDELAPVMAQFMQQVSDAMPAITAMVVTFAKAIAGLGGAILSTASALDRLTGENNIRQVMAGREKLAQTNSELAQQFNQAQETMGRSMRLTAQDIAKMDTTARNSLIRKFGKEILESSGEAQKAGSNFQTSFKGIGIASTSAANEAASAKKKIAEAMHGLAIDYRDVEQDIEESLAKLEDDHTKTVGSISGKIGDLKKQLDDLEAAYRKTTQGFDTTQAEGVVGQEQKIADLRKQLEAAKIDYANGLQAGNPDGSRMAELQTQLQKEQAAYDAFLANNKLNDADLAEARRRASATQFERDMEDLATRRAEATADFEEKKRQIQETVQAEQDALAAETLIYEAKRLQYAQTAEAAIAFKDTYVGALADMKTQTQQSADIMKQKLGEIRDTLAQIESARNAAKIASASSSGVTGGTSKVEVKLDLGGVTVNSGADADALVKKMSDQLLNTLRLAGLASG